MGTAIGGGQDGVKMSRIWRRSANMVPLWAQHVARRPQARANVGPTCSKTSRWSPMCPIWSPMAPTCTQHLPTSSGAETSSKTGLPVTPKSQGQDEISVYRGGLAPRPPKFSQLVRRSTFAQLDGSASMCWMTFCWYWLRRKKKFGSDLGDHGTTAYHQK